MLGAIPAQAQDIPELAGGPGQRPLAVNPAPTATQKKAQAAADKLKASQAKLTQQADAQKAEQDRLDKVSADLAKLSSDLKTRQTKLDGQQTQLDARAATLAAEAKRLDKLAADLKSQQDANAVQLAQIRDAERKPPIAVAAPETEPPPLNAPTEPSRNPNSQPRDYASRDDSPSVRGGYSGGRPDYARVNMNLAEQTCIAAAQNAARARNYYSASYDTRPQLYNHEGLELRGEVRLEMQRGYRVFDSVCQVDADGNAQRFTFLR